MFNEKARRILMNIRKLISIGLLIAFLLSLVLLMKKGRDNMASDDPDFPVGIFI